MANENANRYSFSDEIMKMMMMNNGGDYGFSDGVPGGGGRCEAVGRHGAQVSSSLETPSEKRKRRQIVSFVIRYPARVIGGWRRRWLSKMRLFIRRGSH